MDDPKETATEKVGPVTIDYDKLDVAGLMDQVSAAAARTQAADLRAERAFASGPASGGPGRIRSAGAPPEGPGGLKGKLKAVALKLMRPFFPLIRFLGLPLHQDIRATQQSLSETDKRIDTLEIHLVRTGERIDKTELRLDLLEERIKDLDESMEYIRLLHNLDHNLVVELTKLRIEFDTLKSKFGILEKDLDYLRARERALEESARP
jgi:uncharacterized coiled-coil protein SlyX